MNPLSQPDPWTRSAAGYSAWTHHHLRRYAEDAIHLLDVSSNAQVLDVACGTGAATLTLAPLVSTVTAVDFATGMLTTLREKLKATETTNVTLVQGDGQALDLLDDAFDHALSMFGLIFFPDRAAGFAELLRCLKPGGSAAVSCWPPGSESPAWSWMLEGFLEGFPDVPPPARVETALDSADRLERELSDAGFVDVQVHKISHDVVVEDIESFWHKMLAGSAPATLLRSNFSNADWERRNANAIESLRRSSTTPLSLPMPAFVGIGRKA